MLITDVWCGAVTTSSHYRQWRGIDVLTVWFNWHTWAVGFRLRWLILHKVPGLCRPEVQRVNSGVDANMNPLLVFQDIGLCYLSFSVHCKIITEHDHFKHTASARAHQRAGNLPAVICLYEVQLIPSFAPNTTQGGAPTASVLPLRESGVSTSPLPYCSTCTWPPCITWESRYVLPSSVCSTPWQKDSVAACCGGKSHRSWSELSDRRAQSVGQDL